MTSPSPSPLTRRGTTRVSRRWTRTPRPTSARRKKTSRPRTPDRSASAASNETDQGETDQSSGVRAGTAQAVRGQVGQGGITVDGHDQVGFGQEAAQQVDQAVHAADGEP